MEFLHHYVQKGERIEYLLNLPLMEKWFMMASMERHFEEEKAKWDSQ